MSQTVKTHEFVPSGGDGCQQCGFGPGALQHNTSQPEWTRTTILTEGVNHPAHYGGDTTYEAIKVIEAWNLNFRLGNVVKYIRRVGHKGHTLENLQKARWYLDREIAAIEREFLLPNELELPRQEQEGLLYGTRTSYPDAQPASIQSPKEEPQPTREEGIPRIMP